MYECTQFCVSTTITSDHCKKKNKACIELVSTCTNMKDVWQLGEQCIIY